MTMRPRGWTHGLLLIWLLGSFASTLCAQSDTQLPDGKQFQFWENPFTPCRTYYVDAANGKDANPGSHDRPFKTIHQAAQVLQPGERGVIASGVYREAVRPARGGTGPDKLISYEAAPGANVILSGALQQTEWGPSTGFASRGQHQGTPQIYEAKLDGAWFGGYNPFGMVNLPQQKAFLVTVGNHLGSSGYIMPWLREKNNLATYYRRRGLVFADGKPLTQVDTFEELFDPAGPSRPGSRLLRNSSDLQSAKHVSCARSFFMPLGMFHWQHY
jgi:Protein of unknown function (DUF1565)